MLPSFATLPAWAVLTVSTLGLGLLLPAVLRVLARVRGDASGARASDRPVIAWSVFALRVALAGIVAAYAWDGVFSRVIALRGGQADVVSAIAALPAALAAATVAFVIAGWLAGWCLRDVARDAPAARP